ncbi:hypothetical protein [Mucilaginibacter sp.]
MKKPLHASGLRQGTTFLDHFTNCNFKHAMAMAWNGMLLPKNIYDENI